MEQSINDLLKKTEEYESALLGLEAEDTGDEEFDTAPYSPDDIRISQYMYSVYQIFHWIEDGILILRPEFQRNRVWEIQRQSLLIESIMLRIPIPTFYFQEDEEGNKLVIDGLQRLSSIYAYMRGEFPLKGLQYLEKCNQMYFSELPKKYRIRIMETQLAVNVLDSKCDEKVKFDVFRRVNTGGVPLNPQEIRNSLASAQVRKLLLDMSSSPEFLKATRRRINDTRMDAQELCLRFIVFFSRYDRHSDKLKNLGALVQMLDSAVVSLNRCSDLILSRWLLVFRSSMRKCCALLGDEAFSKENNEMVINKPLFITWAVLLFHHGGKDLKVLESKQTEAVRLQHQYFREGIYYNAITSSTAARKNIELQFEAVSKILKELDLW